MCGQEQKAGVWGTALALWHTSQPHNKYTHHTILSLLLYWWLLQINKNDLGVHPPFGCIILEVPSLQYSSRTVQRASRARVIYHWFPASSLSPPDSLAPSHCTQHKKLTSSYTLLMHMHNNPLFCCPLVIPLFHYRFFFFFHFPTLSSFISFVISSLCALALFLKSLHRSLFFSEPRDDLSKCSQMLGLIAVLQILYLHFYLLWVFHSKLICYSYSWADLKCNF